MSDRALPQPTSSPRPGHLCSARKKDGSRCQRYAVRGRDRCAAHPREGDAPGAPSKFTPEVQEEIIRNLASGVGIGVAAGAAGVSERIVHMWLSRAEQDEDAGVESDFVVFFQRVTRARAQVQVALAAQITAAARPRQVQPGRVPGDWRAAAWMLERLDPKNFGRQATTVQHDHGGHVTVGMELLGGRQPVDIPRWKREQIIELLEESGTIEGTATQAESDTAPGARSAGEL